LALLGRGGLLDEWWGVRLDTTVWAILLAHVFFNYAVVVRTVGGLWAQLDPRQEEAARVLGASRFTAWRRVTLPALAPAVAAAALMVFLFTFTSFGVVQI
ncbi:ABC transporter permease subunit, partial [Streptomyces sp. DT225]